MPTRLRTANGGAASSGVSNGVLRQRASALFHRLVERAPERQKASTGASALSIARRMVAACSSLTGWPLITGI